MGKRFFSLLLALAMVVSMIPASAIPTFAAETETGAALPNMYAAYAENVSVDGTLNENAWLTYGKMTSEDGQTSKAFGVLWDAENLYFAGEGTDEVTVTINEEDVDAEASVGTNAWELEIPLESVSVNVDDYGDTVEVTLTSGDCSWTGTVTFDAIERTYIPTYGTAKGSAGNGGTMAVDVATAGQIVMSNTHASGSTAVNKDARVYAIDLSAPVMHPANKTSVVEFDFYAEDMPAYSDNPAKNHNNNLCDGFVLAAFQGANGHGYTVGIANTETEGLHFCAWTSGESRHSIKLNKQEGDVFHVRLEYDPSGDLHLYVDDSFVHTFENTLVVGGWSTSTTKMLNFNLYDYSGSSESMKFTLSGIRASSVDRNPTMRKTVDAYVASVIPTLDGVLDEYVWAMPYDFTAVNGNGVSGQVSAVWKTGSLYLGVAHSGASELVVKLADKSWTIPLTAGNAASEDGLVTGKVTADAAELKIDMLGSGAEIWDYFERKNLQVIVKNGENSAALTADDYAWLTFSNYETARFGLTKVDKVVDGKVVTAYTSTDGTLKFEATGADRRFIGLGTEMINHAHDTYVEQKLTFTKFDNATGNLGGGATASGYCMWFVDKAFPAPASGTSGTGTLACIYNDNGALKIKVNSSQGASVFDLGKKVGDTFTLGYLWTSDNTANIYVDGVLVGTKENVSYTLSGLGHDTITLNTNNCDVDLTVHYVDFNTARGSVAPTNTLDGLMTGVETANLTEDLPATYTNGHFAYNVDWNSGNTDVVSDSGKVTQADKTTVVTLKPMVAGVTLGTVEVTVPGNEKLELATGSYEAYVASDVTADGKLDETVWFSGAKLGLGQEFDILWDGGNLYFGVEAAEGDTELTVLLGDEPLTTATLADGASAFEVKLPYTTKGVTKLTDLTLKVGNSAWKGDVTLASMMRFRASEALSVLGGTVTKSADGSAATLTLAPATAAAVIDRSTLGKDKNTFLSERNGDVSISLNLDPTAIPVTDKDGAPGASLAAWAGPTILVSDGSGEAVYVGIWNMTDRGLVLFVKNTGKFLDLGRTASEGAFNLELVWTQEATDSLHVYVNGVSVGTMTNVTHANDGIPDYKTDNLIAVIAMRHNGEDHGFYNQKVEVTVSDVVLTKAVKVTYGGEATGTYDAFVAADIVVDGAMTETAWRTGAKLGGGQPFDILFDGNNLYFGVVAATGDKSMTVKIGDEVVAETSLASGTTAMEAVVPYLTKDVTKIENVTIAVDELSIWTGDVNLNLYSRVYKPDFTNTSVFNTIGIKYYSGNTPDGNLSYSATADSITAANEYKAGKLNEVNGRVHYLQADNFALTNNRTGDQVVEFDFYAENLPAYSNTSNIGTMYAAYGFNCILADGGRDGIQFGIMKASEDSKLYMVLCWDIVDENPASTDKKVKFVALGKEEGETFSVRVVWTLDNTVNIYVDGVFMGKVENCLHKNLRGTNAFGFDLWGPGAMCALTSDGANDNKWTVSNVRVGQTAQVDYSIPDDGEFTAPFVTVAPAADSMTWDSLSWESFANGEGKAAVLICDQKVYLGVKATGAVSATLGSETKTADADGFAILTFDNTLITAYGQELAIALTLDGTAAWDDGAKVTVVQKSMNPAGKMPTNDASSRVTFGNGTYTMSTTDSVNNSNGAYILLRKTFLNDLTDHNSNLLFEQTMTITKMSHGDQTGTFPGGAVNNHGYTVMVEYGLARIYSAVIGPDASGNLSFYAYTADESVKSLALGKKVGDTFKLGLLWATDGSTTVYVDNVNIGTIENAAYAGKVYNGAASDISMLIKYQDAVCSEANPAEITATIPVLTKFGTQVDLPDLETEVTKEGIFGDLDLTDVQTDLPLVTTFDSAYLGEQPLRWTTSNADAVEADGTIHPAKTEAKNATLSVFLGDGTTAIWSVDVTVPASNASLDAMLSEETVVVDGKLSELVWLDWMKFGNRVPGNIAAAWTKGNAYFAVYSKDAKTLNMTVNGKTVSIDLVNATASGAENITVARNAKSGVVEIGIPMDQLGINLTDYNQSVDFVAELVNGEAVSALNAVMLTFTGDVAELLPLASYTKDNGPWTLLTNEIGYKGTTPGKVNYVYKTENNIDHNQLFVLSNEFQFDVLPISTGKMIGAQQADGFYYYFGDEDPDTRAGITVGAAIYTEDGTNLKLRISQGANAEGYVFDLGKTLGERFRITYYWYPNNNLEIYVDGVLLGTAANAGLTSSYIGVDVITYRYYSKEATGEKVQFGIYNLTKVTTKYTTFKDELTTGAVFGRIDLDHVQGDLPMVTSFDSINFAALNLEWETSDPSIVTVDGKVTRHPTEYKSATVTVYYVGGGAREKLWSVKVTVDPMSVTKQEAPAVIHTAFTTPITMDGKLTDEGWLMNGWVVNDAGQAVGYFGALWSQEYLYIGVEANGTNVVSVKLGDTIVALDMVNKTTSLGTIAVSGTTAEVKIPVSALFGVNKITEYGKTIAIRVALNSAEYNGTLWLTSVDWWAADKVYAGLPMLAGNYKSIAMGTSDQPDGNQGAKQLENGWHVYDLYNPTGSNPAGIRTYVLFMKMPVYENFADRSQATHVEFDFYAASLPEWEWDEGMKDEINRAFANYGVTFSLSDKADATKNSNVAVFGIVNTKDGLMLAVNRGTEDSAAFKLNKKVGEEFRIGFTWLLTGDMVVYIDGVEYMTINGMSKFVNSVGDTSFVVNMIRNKVKPTSEADNMDVYLTNIAFGRSHSTENIIRNLTIDQLLNGNDNENEILTDLSLPVYMTNGQLDARYELTWISSDPSVINTTGKVTRPATGAKVVTLTAELTNNGVKETKEFSLVVLGEVMDNGNVLVVSDDVNPFGMAASAYKGALFNFDRSNNSVVYAFPEGTENMKINLVTLTDLDAAAKLNRESLRLFVSNDNKTYTEITSYKLHQDGNKWYLYNFEANARYIKVHYTHRDIDAVTFVNTPGEMLKVSWNESLVIPADAATIAVPATTLLDEAVAITLPDGITADGLRVALGNEILFHYVDKSGTVYVRIADPTTGSLKLWNADDIELADKENVYEVTYGTRETLPSGGRWVIGLKAGQTFPDGSSLAVDTLFSMGGKTVNKSTDGGYTWTKVGTVSHDTGLDSGGWGIDSITGRLFHEFYYYVKFVNGDVTSSECITYVFYSDDGGKTWTKAEGLGKVSGDLQSNYVLSYTDITELAYDPVLGKGNDGKGPNVDFVFPMGAQYNNNGAFCSRVAYTRDGGLTWQYSDSKISYGNETAFEGGVSEATILEREDGTLVFYARCQSSGVDNFTISYSLDHGVTWLTPGETSTVYTTNTQALMMTYDFEGFDGSRLTGAPIFMWGGNNVLGGNSYMRMPLNFAVSTNGMDTFRQIQNSFSKTFMDVLDFEADHYITNASIQQIDGDDMYMSFSRLRHGDSVYMVFNDFTDWFLRSKGAYDSFEHGTAKYEGWVLQKGAIEVVKDKVSVGNNAMLVRENTNVTRTVPYLQNGSVSIDLYVTDSSNFVLELQPAFAIVAQKCAVISAEVKGTTMTLHDGTVLTLKDGWNTVAFDLELVDYKAAVGVNGGEMKRVEIDTTFVNAYDSHELGNYITYISILAISDVYVDELLVISELDAVTEATEAEEAAADALVEDIKAIGEVTIEDEAAIKAARATYNAMNQVERDFVNRRVPTGTTTNANDEGALINYYEVLLAAEEALKILKPDEDKIVSESISLKGKVDVNVYVSLTEETLKDEGAHMLFTLLDGEEIKVSVQDAEQKEVDGEILYVFSCSVPAKEMTDEINAQFIYGDGTVMAEDTYTVQGYGEYVLADTNNAYTQAHKNLVNTMLHYGAAAQIHFNYNTDRLANDADSVTAVNLDSVTAATVAEHAYRSAATGNELVKFYGNSLILKGETTMRFFFKVSEGGNLSVKLNGENLEVNQRGGLHYVSVENIAAKDLSTDITLIVSDGTNEFTVTANALTYAYNVLKAGEGTYGEALVDLVKALTLYSQAADSYYG